MIENKLKKTNNIQKMVPSKNKVMNEDSSSNLTEPKKIQISDLFKNSIEENTLNQKQTSKFEEMNKCEICELIFSVNEFMSIGECEHSYCHLCLRQYIIYKAGMFERRIKCPDQICEERLSQKSKVYSYLPEDVQKRIKKIQEYHEILKSPNQRLCPHENCPGHLILKSGQKGQLLPTSKCETCKTTFCTKCFFKKHKGDCDNYHLDFFKNNLNYKQCAKCQRIIEKLEGCHHITCTCGYQFCYICGKEWSHDHLCKNQLVVPRNCFSPCPECIQIVCKIFLANLLLLCSIIYYILLIPFTLSYFLFFLLVAVIGGPCFLSIKLTSLTSKDLTGHLFSTLNLDIFTLPVFHLFDLKLYQFHQAAHSFSLACFLGSDKIMSVIHLCLFELCLSGELKKEQLKHNLNIQMIQQLQHLEEYLSTNNLQHTLQSLRSEILGLYPQAPSQQFISTVENGGQKKSNTQFSSRVQEKKSGLRKKQQLVVQGLLGKIAYSSKLLQDPNLNDKISKMMDNRIFQKTVSSMFPESSHKNPPEEKSYDFKDELDFAQMPNQNESINYPPPNNMISHIDMEQESSSILSQPSLVLQELNRHETTVDEYKDDNDLGYEEYQFTENELLSGCSKLTKKYGYPDKAVKKNSKQQINIKKNQKKKDGSKFPNGIMFPDSSDSLYPLQYSGVIYDVLKLKVVFDREKTGYEETKEINIKEGEILAGRYRVESVLGSGVFAKVLKVTDLMKGQLTCLKMISNNKDFFDQALDEIKILRYISSNCDPDQEHLLKFKNVFYHREHLFIQTELLKDNLFIAYRKNGSLFSIPVIREIARQILQALNTLHKLQIIHADLKPENILIKSINPIEVKVIDLGNSCFFHDHLGEYVQSRSYRAPEVVLGVGYDEKIDIWSLGCILAQLWTKNVLFYNVHVPGMLARIQSIIGPWPEWMLDNGQGVENLFSKENLIYYEEEAKFHILIPKKTTLKDRVRTEDEEFLSFIQATLRIDPNFRLSAEEALMHPFLNHQ